MFSHLPGNQSSTRIEFSAFNAIEATQLVTLKILPHLSSRRVRDACLPSLFRKLSIEFSNKRFYLFESILESNLQYIASFEYVAPMLLRPGKCPERIIRETTWSLIWNTRWNVFKSTNSNSWPICRNMRRLWWREWSWGWDEMEYDSSHYHAYMPVYKKLWVYDGQVPSSKRS